MALLNYTTTVSADRTVAEIHKMLVGAGARQIMSTYNADSRPVGVAFAVETALGLRHFHLPVRSDRVEAVLLKQRVERRFCNPQQAERVAWRIIKDWLEAQLAIIRAEMVTFDQVMLPYMATDGGQSMYELYREQQLALTAG